MILLTLVVQLAYFREPGLVVRVAPGLATGAQQPSPPAIERTSSDVDTASIRLDALTQRLASYEKELDAVNRVATALIGLASLYALALGVSQYLSTDYAVKRLDRAIADAKEDIKHATERSKESATVVQQMQGDLARQYPMMQGLGAALSGIVDQLNRLLKTLAAYLAKVVNVDEEARKDLARDLADDLKWVAERRPNEMAKIRQQAGL